MIDDLKQVFGSLGKSLEILFLLEDVKPCIRQGFYEDELKVVRKFCKDKGLHVATADYKIVLDSSANKGVYSNKGVKVSLLNGEKGMMFVYISKYENLAQEAKRFEQRDDFRNLGLALGYPSCCCDFFVKNEPVQSKGSNDYVLPALNNSQGFVFPKETNVCARYFDYSLLSHFPCSFHCEKSIVLAKKYLDVVIKHDKKLASELMDVLGSAVLYHEFAGVFLLHDYRLEDNLLSFSSIMNTQQGRIFDDLVEKKSFRIVGKNSIVLKDKKVTDQYLGVLVFF
jgi:hypothetical protein